MNPVAPSVQPTRLLDQVRESAICNYYRLNKENFLLLLALFYIKDGGSAFQWRVRLSAAADTN